MYDEYKISKAPERPTNTPIVFIKEILSFKNRAENNIVTIGPPVIINEASTGNS